jgi:hypothetical protein
MSQPVCDRSYRGVVGWGHRIRWRSHRNGRNVSDGPKKGGLGTQKKGGGGGLVCRRWRTEEGGSRAWAHLQNGRSGFGQLSLQFCPTRLHLTV